MTNSTEYNLLYEQLLQEAFLDSIKNYTKDKFNQTVDVINDWKDAAVIFGKILSDEKLLNDFLPPLQRRFEAILKSLYDFLKKLGLDSFISIIDNIKNKIFSLGGLKKLLSLTGIGSIAYYIVNFAKSLPKDEIITYVKSNISIDFFNKLISSSVLANWSSFIGVLQPIIKGVQSIYGFLKDLILAFSTAFKSNNKFATKLVKENKMSNLRELIRQAIAEIIEEENVTSGGEAYMTKFFLSKGGKNRATKYAEKSGMKVVNESQESINEASYRSFNKSVSEVSPKRKVSNAIRSINKRLNEIDQLTEFTLKIQQEHGLTNETQLINSIKGLEAITKKLAGIYKKIKILKQ
jgi:2C-methyl-D-erythritol 2,4-cyclodiphosphate synthase